MPDQKPRKRKPTRQALRLRAILGGDGDRLPRVGLETLRRFHGYLVEHLAFPFGGHICDPIGPHRDTRSPLTVVRLLDPLTEYSPEEMHGLICKAVQAEGGADRVASGPDRRARGQPPRPTA